MALSDAELEQYKNLGWVVVPQFLTRLMGQDPAALIGHFSKNIRISDIVQIYPAAVAVAASDSADSLTLPKVADRMPIAASLVIALAKDGRQRA